MSHSINTLINNISYCLQKNCFFSFSSFDGQTFILQAQQESSRVIFEQIDALCTYTKNSLIGKSLRAISLDERELLRDLVDVSCRAIKLFFHRFGPACVDDAHVLYDRALELKLGGKVNINLLKEQDKKEFSSFILANHLHHKMQALGQQMSHIPSVAVEGINEPIAWESLRAETQLCPQDGIKVISFYCDDRLVFQTDEKLKLLEDYTYLDGKISRYNRWSDPKIRPYDRQEPTAGRFTIELWTVLNDVEGLDISIPVGDHTCVVLVSESGDRYGVGQMIHNSVRKLEVPDSYLMSPKSCYSYRKTEFLIDKACFDNLLKHVESLRGKDMGYSVLRKNCSSFAGNLLEIAGVCVDRRIHVIEILARKILPVACVNWLCKRFDNLPSALRKGLCFFPPFYIVSLLIGCLSCFFRNKFFSFDPSELSFCDILFFPWNIAADHPFAIRKWQEKNDAACFDLTSGGSP